MQVADGNEPTGDTMNPAVSNEIDLIGREMSRIMQELSDGREGSYETAADRARDNRR